MIAKFGCAMSRRQYVAATTSHRAEGGVMVSMMMIIAVLAMCAMVGGGYALTRVPNAESIIAVVGWYCAFQLGCIAGSGILFMAVVSMIGCAR